MTLRTPATNAADTFYPDRLRPAVDERLFRHPSAIYRGAPFWAWNSALDRKELVRQVRIFKRMGLGGFHAHVRSGMATEYLGREFLEHLHACVIAAKKLGLHAWLYDEDRWPSGFAGGLVTRDPAHRAKYILFTAKPYSGIRRPTPNISCGSAGRLENGTLLARYAVRLRRGVLVDYRRLTGHQPAPPGSEEWFAYLETVDGTPWFNHQGYVDTLSPAAIERFVAVTHARYRKKLANFFGREIPAIFTDEPQHLFKEALARGAAKQDVTLPATTDFFATYQTAYGEDLLNSFPELFWERVGGEVSASRYRYHDHVTHRFAEAYSGTLGRWTQRHGLALTGHMMEEQTLGSQTRAVGDVMRSLAHFQLPGIDMLCDRLEITTAKQAQSVAHQYGRAGVVSELYGVTGWNYDFAGHKAQGDWQAALGVTVRVPHLSWSSMAGEAKRDYPASIFEQSPWWREYPAIEDHFARLNVVLTRGRPLVRVAVIHPIESFWLACGPEAETRTARKKLEKQFQELPDWLLRGVIDFDFLCEALLPEQSCATNAGSFQVGAMVYEVVIVPMLRTLRATTVEMLEAFVEGGGRVILAGAVPTLVDAAPSGRVAQLVAKAVRCAWKASAVLQVVEAFREIDCFDRHGQRYGELFHQWRADGAERHLFLCHRERTKPSGPLTLVVRGTWRVFARDTFTGSVTELPAKNESDKTEIPLELAAHGHALLTLRPGISVLLPRARKLSWRNAGAVSAPVKITLSEPNVLLLDQAEWRWNDEPWEPREELLRIGNRLRERCQLPPRDGNDAQPWVDAKPAETLGRVSLRFTIESDVAVSGAELALEDAADWELRWDGQILSRRSRGHWVDRAIHKVALPPFRAGKHELVLVRDYTRKTEIEWSYLLGDFGVTAVGTKVRLVPSVRSLAYGNWTRQRLPFYAGNVIYHCRFHFESAGRVAVRLPKFKSPVLSVNLVGGKSHVVAFAPFRAELGFLKRGWHRLEITVYGNRHNAFGPLHNRNRGFPWQIPQAWRSTGRHWSYDYQFEPMGLLTAPVVEVAAEPVA